MRRLLASLLAVVAALATGCSAHPARATTGTPAARRTATTAAPAFAPAAATTLPAATVPAARTPSGAAAASVPRSPAATSAPQSSGPVTRARTRIGRLTAYLGHQGVSIAAGGPGGRILFRYGAQGGMRTASIAKLYILETLLLQHQRSRQLVDASDRALAQRMIENSDNDAANDLYARIGAAAGLRRAAGPLGVHHTVPGPDWLWGYTKTTASDYIALLADLTTNRVLHPGFRRYARILLAHVEADQRWGVSAAADPGTHPLVKNGWLGVSVDGYRWAVNSVGIVTVGGRTMLLAVLTQHGRDFAGGVALVERLARITARVARVAR